MIPFADASPRITERFGLNPADRPVVHTLEFYTAARMEEFRLGSILEGLDTAIEAALNAHQRSYRKVGKLPDDMDGALGTAAYDLIHKVRSDLLLDMAPRVARLLAERDLLTAQEEQVDFDADALREARAITEPESRRAA